MSHAASDNPHPPDRRSPHAEESSGEAVIDDIVAFVVRHKPLSEMTIRTAGWCLLDAIGCAIGALDDEEIENFLGPFVPGTVTPFGARVPGTSHVLDPVKGSFDISALIRWLDLSDTSPVGGHPSDNIGAILAVSDHISQVRRARGEEPLRLHAVIHAMVDAYEIQGSLAASNHFDSPEVGLDHVISVKIASAAVACRLMGGTPGQIRTAVANAWLDGHSLNAYRHVPNAGPRKGWAGAEAASRGVFLAWMAVRGEQGYPQPLSAPTWGFSDVLLKGRPVRLRPLLGSFFMDNVIFKLVPVQRNASTAVEAAILLHPWFRENAAQVARIMLWTHDEAMRRIVKSGDLPNRAARDHCLQYAVAIALLKGRLTLADYADDAAAAPEVDRLRGLMTVEEDRSYSEAHHVLEKSTCSNAIEIVTADGRRSPRIEIHYPIGDVRRRTEAAPMIRDKFKALAGPRLTAAQQDALVTCLTGLPAGMSVPVPDLMQGLSRPHAGHARSSDRG